jgi:hypothetical protein
MHQVHVRPVPLRDFPAQEVCQVPETVLSKSIHRPTVAQEEANCLCQMLAKYDS